MSRHRYGPVGVGALEETPGPGIVAILARQRATVT